MIPAVAFAANTNVTTAVALRNALAAANDGDTITLNSVANFPNVTPGLIYTGGKSVTIITNGKALNVTGNDGVTVSGAGSELKIDTSGGGSFNVTGSLTTAVHVSDGGKLVLSSVTITGTPGRTGILAEGEGSSVVVTGNVNASAGTNTSNVGVSATGGATVTIDGTIDPAFPTYISVGGVAKAAGDYENPPTCENYKPGYFTYTDGTSIVWVKGDGVPEPDPEFAVKVDPASVTLEQGVTQQFKATVTAVECYGEVDQTVKWEVIGASSAKTSIDADGLLTVGADETAKTLTVRAISPLVDNDALYGEAEVTVTAKEDNNNNNNDNNNNEENQGGETSKETTKTAALPLPGTGDNNNLALPLSVGAAALAAGVIFLSAAENKKRRNA